MGYERVRHFTGGHDEWEAHGLPLVRERVVVAPADVELPSRRRRAVTRSIERATSRSLQRLADAPFGLVLSLWALIVVACGVVFWTASALGHPVLVAAGRPLA